jgi:hypothetical protein
MLLHRGAAEPNNCEFLRACRAFRVVVIRRARWEVTSDLLLIQPGVTMCSKIFNADQRDHDAALTRLRLSNLPDYNVHLTISVFVLLQFLRLIR